MTIDRSNRPSCIDLFSGAGGLAEGFGSAGIAVTAAVELHPQPALTHAFNHPGAAVFVCDIRELELQLLETRVAKKTQGRPIDIVVGGPPCQWFSTAGKRSQMTLETACFSSSLGSLSISRQEFSF